MSATAASTSASLELLPLPPLSSAFTTRDKLPVRLIIMQSNGSAAPKEVRLQRYDLGDLLTDQLKSRCIRSTACSCRATRKNAICLRVP